MRVSIKVRALRVGDVLVPTGRTIAGVGVPWREAGTKRACCVVAFTTGASARWQADTTITVERPPVQS